MVTLTAKDEHCMSTSVLSLTSVGVTVKVHVVDLEKEKVAPPTNVRPLLSWTVKDLYSLIHEVIRNRPFSWWHYFDYNYQNSFCFCFLTEICQSCWGLNNNSSNLHKKTSNWRILFIVTKNDVIIASLSHIFVFFRDVTEPLLVLIFSKKVRVEDKT